MIGEVGMWIARILAVLPQLMGLWEAAKKPFSPRDELDAQLALVRAIKDRQAKEDIEGGGPAGPP